MGYYNKNFKNCVFWIFLIILVIIKNKKIFYKIFTLKYKNDIIYIIGVIEMYIKYEKLELKLEKTDVYPISHFNRDLEEFVDLLKEGY